ncbi:hypothetical protein DIPPA_21518 [Diplonema papillatum]|nr:hypothetical protein DIPPA_21518 [Diplonema papillatum]
MSSMLRSGWYDAAEICSAGGAPKTYEKAGTRGTRIDHILLNDVAMQALVASETTVVVDGEGQRVPSHKMVTVELDIAAFADTCERFRMPRSLRQMSKVDEGRAAARAEELLVKNRFGDAAPGNVEALWLSATKACEQFLIELAEEQGLLDGPVAAYRGRGETRVPKRVRIASAMDTGTGADTYASSRVRKAMNGLDAYIRGLQALNGEGPGCMPRSLEKTWQNVVSGLDSMAGQIPKVRNLPRRPPDLSVAQTVRQKLEARSRTLTAQARKGRIAQLENKMQNLQREQSAVATVVQEEEGGWPGVEGQYTANARQIDAALQKEWAPVNRMYEGKQEPSYEAFRTEYAEYIEHRPMECRDLTGEDLKSVLGKKRDGGVPGVDGWDTAELKKLSLPLLNALVAVFNAIEATGTWPDALLEAAVTLIPKDETLDPLALRPITVTSAIYRLWASTRLRDVVQWQEKWIADSQHGFRPKHGTVDVVFEIASQIEEALLRCLLAVLPAATYGSEFALPTVRGLGKFTAALVRGVWDPVRMHRAQEAVWAFSTSCEVPLTRPIRSAAVSVTRHDRRSVPKKAGVEGPRRNSSTGVWQQSPRVGTGRYCGRACKKARYTMDGRFRRRRGRGRECAEAGTAKQGERGHTLRKAIHGWRLGELEKRRADFGGVRAGVDFNATNAYGLKASTTLTAARDVAEVVAGSVMTESHAAKLWEATGCADAVTRRRKKCENGVLPRGFSCYSADALGYLCVYAFSCLLNHC